MISKVTSVPDFNGRSLKVGDTVQIHPDHSYPGSDYNIFNRFKVTRIYKDGNQNWIMTKNIKTDYDNGWISENFIKIYTSIDPRPEWF
jgi:hypothetical protein